MIARWLLAAAAPGVLNDPSDEDEEWVVEAALPLMALGLAAAPGTRFSVAISRCDTPRAGAGDSAAARGPRACWSSASR